MAEREQNITNENTHTRDLLGTTDPPVAVTATKGNSDTLDLESTPKMNKISVTMV